MDSSQFSINPSLSESEKKIVFGVIEKLYPENERENRFQEKNDEEKKVTNEEIKFLTRKSSEIFMSEPVLLELSAPIVVCGDTHGQFNDLIRLFSFIGRPPQVPYLFLGDYVDRGKKSVETISLMLAFKIFFPSRFFLLRGNHEAERINLMYGFYDECRRRYDLRVWKMFSNCFNWLPISALISSKILCMHGGLSPDLDSLDSIRRIVRPTEVPDEGLLCDLLWSDPDKEAKGWEANQRGVSVVYGEEVVEEVTEKLNVDLICRAHQVVENGYEFFASRKLVTVFSAPNYCGQFDNCGGIMTVNEELVCGFKVLRPKNLGKKNFSVEFVRSFTPPPKKKEEEMENRGNSNNNNNNNNNNNIKEEE